MDDASALGYPRAWLDFGLLNAPLLADQLARFRAGEAEALDPAHLRRAAFARLLRRRALSDELIDQYVQLARLDPDRDTGTAALLGLLDHPALTEEQLQRLRPIVADDPVLEQRYRCVRGAVTRR